MQFAIDIPNFLDYADPHLVAEVAREAEGAGWDAIWVWDHILRSPADPHADPWILLAAIASATTRIRLGPMVVPLARRRPSDVARQAVTLDHLSRGRLTLGVGSGSRDHEFTAFGDAAELRTRAEMLDEGLAVITGLWSGGRVDFDGRHFHTHVESFLPVPVQRPRIPVWVAATWPVRAPLRRAARWDGVWPLKRDAAGNSISVTPEDVRGVCGAIAEERAAAGPAAAGPAASGAGRVAAAGRERPFDVLVAGRTPGDDPAAAAGIVGEFADAGATWWTERINRDRGDMSVQRERIRQGPPRL